MADPTEWNRPSVPPNTADILERLPTWELNHSIANKTIRSLCGEVDHLRELLAKHGECQCGISPCKCGWDDMREGLDR